MSRLVRIVLDERVPAGRVELGGVRIVEVDDDAALGRELRTSEVRCHDRAAALRLAGIVATTVGLELTSDSPIG